MQIMAFSHHFQDELSAGGAAHRLPLALLFAALPLVAAAEKPVLQGTGLWENVDTVKIEPATDITEECVVRRLVRLSKTRYLALVAESRHQLDRWVDPKTIEEQRKTKGFVDVPLKIFKDSLALVFLDPQGRIIKHSTGGPEVPEAMSPFPNSHHLPLVVEGSDRCPYALLQARERVLVCYDHELGYLGKHEIPLDEIGVPVVSLQAGEPSIVFFGKNYRERPKVERFGDLFRAKPEVPVGFGQRFAVEEGTWSPLPIDPIELAGALSRVARGPAGEKVKISPASVQLVPIRETSPAESFDVLITGVSAQEFVSLVQFFGVHHFFRARFTPTGLGSLAALPFWVVQEERTEVDIRQANGGTVVHVPAVAKLFELQAHSRGEQRFAFYMMLTYKQKRDDGSYDPDWWHAIKLLSLFSGKDLDKVISLDDDEILEPAARSLSTSDRSVNLIKFIDFLGKDECAFLASAYNPRNSKETYRRGIAFLRLED
ncbi:MAG: hypothetical protein ACUVRY_10590 [Thermoanaerobaculaceae bacterium]